MAALELVLTDVFELDGARDDPEAEVDKLDALALLTTPGGTAIGVETLLAWLVFDEGRAIIKGCED